MLNKISDFVTDLKGVLVSVLSVWTLIRKHAAFFISLAIIIVLFAGAYFYAFYYPAQTIHAFFSDLDRKHHQDAWERMDKTFRERRWKKGIEEFSPDYESTLLHQIEQVEHVDASLAKLFSALFAKSAVYQVEVLAEDRFTGEMLKHPWQSFNERWLRLRHPNSDVDALVSGQPTRDGGESLSIKRRFLLEVTLKKDSLGWRIAGFRWREVGLIWRSDK